MTSDTAVLHDSALLPSRLRAAWLAGQPAFGAWLTVPSPPLVEMVGEIDWDYLCLDAQHGFFGYADLLNSLIAMRYASTDVLVRVPDNEPTFIGKVLDAGATGVVVPMVETAAAAERAVNAIRYAPQGSRSYGPIRAARVHGARSPQVLGSALCVVMIETPIGLANLEEICAVDGVDAVYVGPADLAVALGLPPGLKRPEDSHRTALAEVPKRAAAVGTPAGIQCSNAADGLDQTAAGYAFATVWKDSAALLDSSAAAWRALSSGATESELLKGYM